MRWVGIDIHKEYVHVTELSEEGSTHSYRKSLDQQGIESLKSCLGPDTQVVMEATSNSFRLCDELSPFTGSLVVAHPCQTRGATSLHLRNDKVASDLLARMLKTGFIKEVWIPDKTTRALRTLIEYRCILSHMKVTAKSRLYSLFMQEMIPTRGGRILNGRGRSYIESTQWGEPHLTLVCNSLIQTHDALVVVLKEIDTALKAWSLSSHEARILMTVPGVGPVIAAALVSQIGSVERFPDSRKLCAYAGIVPRVHESGKSLRKGRITRAGRHLLRWALSLAVPHVVRRSRTFQVFHQRLIERKPRRVAHVACARKLLTVIWHMLIHKKPFNEEDKELTGRKLEALNRLALSREACSFE